jgi:hypothetical protein
MNTKNIKLIQYDSDNISFNVDKNLLTTNSKIFLQYKKDPIDSSILTIEINPGDYGNEWFPTMGNNSTIQWNVMPEHTLVNISKITSYGYGLLLIDGNKRKTLSNGNILLFPSYNSPWIVKESFKRIEKEVIYASDNQVLFNTNILLSDELLIFVDGLMYTDYTRLSNNSFSTLHGLSQGTQVVIYSVNKQFQESLLSPESLELLDRAILKATTNNQTDFTVSGFVLSTKETLTIFTDSVLVENFERINDTTVRLETGVPIGTQVVILSPRVIGTIIKPIENKQILSSDGKINVYGVNQSVDVTGYFKSMKFQILTAVFDGQNQFTVTEFNLNDNLIVFVNFIVSKDYTKLDNTITLNESVPIGTKIIVYSIQ